MTPKIEIFGQKYAHFGCFEGSFWTIFEGQKSRFLKIFKVVFKALFSDTYTLCYP